MCFPCSSLQHRRLLYDMFTKNYRLRRNMIQAKLAEELGDVPKSDVDRLLNVRWATGKNICSNYLFNTDLTSSLLFQECCKSHAGMWYLKGTIQSWHWDPAPCGHRQPIKSSPRCPVGGQSERWQPITALWALQVDKDVSPDISSAQNLKLFLFQPKHFWSFTRALWRSAEDRNSSQTQSIGWRVWGEKINIRNEETEKYNYGLWVNFWI